MIRHHGKAVHGVGNYAYQDDSKMKGIAICVKMIDFLLTCHFTLSILMISRLQYLP